MAFEVFDYPAYQQRTYPPQASLYKTGFVALTKHFRDYDSVQLLVDKEAGKWGLRFFDAAEPGALKLVKRGGSNKSLLVGVSALYFQRAVGLRSTQYPLTQQGNLWVADIKREDAQ